MAKTIAVGYTDTAIGGFASLAPSLGVLNWGVDLKTLSKVPGEIVASNVTSPTDQPETIRLAQRKVSDVYAGTSIDPLGYLPSRQGTSTLIELREVWVETSSTDETYRKYIPFRCGLSFTLPIYGGITAAMAQTAVLRTVAALFERATSDTTGMTAIQRGVLNKSGL